MKAKVFSLIIISMKKVPPKPKVIHNRIYLISASVVFLILITIFTISNFLYFRVSISGQNKYFVSTSKFETLADDQVNDFKQTSFNLNIDGSDVHLNFNDLGISFSEDQTSNWRLGTKKSLLENLRKNWEISTGGFKPSYQINYQKLVATVNNTFNNRETKPKDAKFDPKNFEISPESSGIVIDRNAFIFDLRMRIENLSKTTININKYESQPKFKKEQFSSALEKIKVLSNQKITLSYNFDTWDLSKELMNFVVFAPKGKPNFYTVKSDIFADQIILNDVYLGDKPSLDQIDITLEPNKITQYLVQIANAVDRDTIDATLEFENGRVTEFTPAEDGQKLDIQLATNLILEKISTDYTSGDKLITITLPVIVRKAKIANEEVNSLGVKELIGSGVSYFAGSIANRAYNVGLGARRLNGFLVKPGENFSFNEAVGEVSGKTGYRQAYVISSGKTVLDDGGGICQVSTTVFRAALNSGFPIVARTAHAYRVGYYEQGGFKAGVDATVWQPSVDLKFKNDSSHHILVQAIVDPARAKLQVDIYGTRDDRKVELSEPVVSNFKSAPEPRYQDDPTLPKGSVKQVDFAAVGATAVFSRKVYKGGEKVIDEKFTSNFRPWQAVFLVGTGG